MCSFNARNREIDQATLENEIGIWERWSGYSTFDDNIYAALNSIPTSEPTVSK